MMEVQHNCGIKLEHLIILLALMSCNTVTLGLSLEFANKDSNCATVSCGVETLSSFCSNLWTPTMHYQCFKQIWSVVAVVRKKYFAYVFHLLKLDKPS